MRNSWAALPAAWYYIGALIVALTAAQAVGVGLMVLGSVLYHFSGREVTPRRRSWKPAVQPMLFAGGAGLALSAWW